MASPAIDITHTSRYFPQHDPDRPMTPRERLMDGDVEALDSFIDYLIEDRTALTDWVSQHVGEMSVSVRKWAEQAEDV